MAAGSLVGQGTSEDMLHGSTKTVVMRRVVGIAAGSGPAGLGDCVEGDLVALDAGELAFGAREPLALDNSRGISFASKS